MGDGGAAVANRVMPQSSVTAAAGPQVAGAPPAKSGTEAQMLDLLGGLQDFVQRLAGGTGSAPSGITLGATGCRG